MVEGAAPQALVEVYPERLATVQRMPETAQTAEVEAAEARVEVVAEEGAEIETEHNRKARALRSLQLYNSPFLLVSLLVAWSKMPRASTVKKTMTRKCALSVLRTSTTTV